MKEPASDDKRSGVGSSSSLSAPRLAKPGLWRAGLLLILVLSTVSSYGLAPIFLPFISALAALVVLRGASRSYLLLLSTISGTLASSLVANIYDLPLKWQLLVVIIFVGLVGFLGPIQAAATRVSSAPVRVFGFNKILLGWLLLSVLALTGVALIGGESGMQTGAARMVSEAYRTYEEQCSDGGLLNKQDELCAELMAQKEYMGRIAERYAPELMTALAALLAFACAATSHIFVLSRTRKMVEQGLLSSDEVRPLKRLRSFETHWSVAYLATIGILLLMMVDRGIVIGSLPLIRSIAIGCIVLAGLLLAAHGTGFLAWLLTRRKTPFWYRALLVVLAVTMVPVLLLTLMGLGILDLAFRLRHRISDTISDRNVDSE